jgi:hypothetical protein
MKVRVVVTLAMSSEMGHWPPNASCLCLVLLLWLFLCGSYATLKSTPEMTDAPVFF